MNRATRQLGDGIALVEEMATTVEATGTATEILAASFRNHAEVVGATRAGAHHVTLSLELLETLGDHPLSEQAIEGFAQSS